MYHGNGPCRNVLFFQFQSLVATLVSQTNKMVMYYTIAIRPWDYRNNGNIREFTEIDMHVNVNFHISLFNFFERMCISVCFVTIARSEIATWTDTL